MTSITQLQKQAGDHQKMMILGGCIGLATLTLFVVLGYFAIQNNLQVRNLNDNLKWWNFVNDNFSFKHPDPAIRDALIAEIHKTTMIGWLNFGFSLASLAIGIFAMRFAAHHHVKRKEALASIEAQQQSHHAQKESEVMDKETIRKRMLIAMGAAAVSAIIVIFLIGFMASNYVKIPGLWDKWHEWHNNKIYRIEDVDPNLGPALQDQIASSVKAGWQEAIAAITFSITGILSAIYAHQQYTKKKALEAAETQKPNANADL